MQGNFLPIPLPMAMNNLAPLHPLEEPNEQEMMTEVLNIAKIKEGFYIGDKISAISIDVIIQFKITHMINATGNQIMNQWESIGISYLTLNWSESPSQILFDSKDEIANRIVEFVDGSLLGKGEGLLAHSLKGQNRVCIVVLIYLMKKYKWSLNKSLQYLKSKKQDVEIPIFFFEQLKQFEIRLKTRGELTYDVPWEFEGLKDPEEKLLRNTYLNGVKQENKNNNNNNPKINTNKNMRHIMWADINPYQKSNLELNNMENDLFFKKEIKPITVHQSLRPRKGCIKGINNSNNGINVNNYNMNMNEVNIKNVEMSMENNFANLIKRSMNLSNNIIADQKNINNNRNNLKIINNNNYFNQNQNNNNINIINNGKLNNNINNINNINRIDQQQSIKQKNIVDNISSPDNFINKERINNFMEKNNVIDMRVNNSVNFPKSNLAMNNQINQNQTNILKNSANINTHNKNNNNKNDNISPFRSNNIENNNNSSAGFMNMNNINKNINNNNNNIYIKNPNNTQQNFYSEKQMNNIINYTPLIKERNIKEQQSQLNNYNPIRGLMNGKVVNNSGNNFNKNIRNSKLQNHNNFGINAKPLNNYNPKLIKHKGITHTDSSLLNRNKNGGPIKIKNNNYINNLSKKPNTPDLNHYNYNPSQIPMTDNSNHNLQNQNPNTYKNNINVQNNKKDFKNDTMAQGWGFPLKNNYNRKIASHPVRPSTAPQKDKVHIHNAHNQIPNNNINNKINPNRSNQFSNNNNKIGRFNQRPSSAGGKGQNQGYGYANNMNRMGNKNNLNKNKKNNINTGINKRLASPPIFNNPNGIGFNGNNQNNIKNKFNPAKNRMPSPVVKSNIGKRPPLNNSGQRIHMNKSEKFN